uniref:Alpha-1,2-fucosyltransferase n=1 Tax=Panagrolaimus superbus TaxID=310955 RepID=A0A914YYR6_9BILA
MFRLAVLYGIGREINRTPFFNANKACQIQAMKEIKMIFPNYYSFAKLLDADRNDTAFRDTFFDVCRYENITGLDETFLLFKYNMPQYYIFFANYSEDIRYFMKFDEMLKQSVKNFANSLFMSDNSHKFCIHIRRGDFIRKSYKYQESRSEFILPASVFINKYLKQEGHENISLVILGQDDEFKHALQFNSSIFHEIYYPSLLSRGHDMAFGTMYCDTYLITASISTFAWWTAFLMPEGKRVFYNGNVLKDGKYYDYDKVFLPHWKKLDLN